MSADQTTDPGVANTSFAPLALEERIEVLDVLRGLAICGILIGNMQWFSGYGITPPSVAAQWPIADQVTHFLVHFFVEGKFYSIFSFLFGFGFALQIARAEERGDTKATLFKRRLFWLLVIGLLHAYLLWAGDILSIYALMGFVLLLFRKKPTGSLLKWAGILIIVPVVSYVILFFLFISFAPPDTAQSVQNMQVEQWEREIRNIPQSGYFEILSGFNRQYIVGRYLGLFFQMRLPKILAMFLIGFYAYRKGIFQNLDANRDLIKRVLVWGLVAGLICNAVMAMVARSEADMPPSAMGIVGVVAYAFGVPAMALFFTALIATMWQKNAWHKILGILAPIGRTALTNYLMQTVICVLIFYGYGLGQYGKVRPLSATLFAFAIFLFQFVFSSLWLKYFGYGPMEWLWRQLTYKTRLSLRRAPLR